VVSSNVRRLCISILLSAVLVIAVLTTVLLAASPIRAAKDFVVDLAEVFTDAEESQLQQAAADLGAKYSLDVVIVTVAGYRREELNGICRRLLRL